MFMGDGGAYLFGSLTALNTITTNNFNPNISLIFLSVQYYFIFFLKYSFHFLEK